MDPALALVREDVGNTLVREDARWLVLFAQRHPGRVDACAVRWICRTRECDKPSHF